MEVERLRKWMKKAYLPGPDVWRAPVAISIWESREAGGDVHVYFEKYVAAVRERACTDRAEIELFTEDYNQLVKEAPIEALSWKLCYVFWNMSCCLDISVDFLKNNLDKEWDWERLSASPVVLMRDIENNPEFPWNYDCVALNPNITRDFIKKHRDKLPDEALAANTFWRQRLLDALAVSIKKFPYEIHDMTCSFLVCPEATEFRYY